MENRRSVDTNPPSNDDAQPRRNEENDNKDEARKVFPYSVKEGSRAKEVA